MSIGPGRKRPSAQGFLTRSVWLYALVLTSVFLLIVGRKDSDVVDSLRLAVTDLTAPAFEAASGPIGSLRSFAAQIGSYTYLSDEVARLRRENEELRSWQTRAREMQSTLVRYEELLNVRKEPELAFVTARVIADARGPFVRTVLVNAGTRQGVRQNQAVMDGRGLVGRTIAIGEEASRVLLVTDLDSRIPVRIEPQGVRAILTGTNNPHPRIDFLPSNTQVQDGDEVYTSGDGGQLPPGLPIGVISISGAGSPRVAPYAQTHRLRFVRIFEYQPSLAIDARNDMPDALDSGGEAAEPAEAASLETGAAEVALEQPEN